MFATDAVGRITSRFCGLALVGLDLLTTQKRNLVGSLRNSQRGLNRRFSECTIEPFEFLKGLQRTLPPLRALANDKRPVQVPRLLSQVIPDAAMFNKAEVREHLGLGATYYWFEFAIYHQRKSGISGLHVLHPVLLARFIYAKASEGRRYAVEVVGDDLFGTDVVASKVPVTLMGGTAFTPGIASGEFDLPSDLSRSIDSRVYVSDEDEDLETFSASVMLALTERLFLPKLQKANATNKTAVAVPPFTVDITCVNDNHSRASLMAQPPVW